ncbi:MAG: DivIVA domain-containing protein [Acidimicrobiia bacterium]
MDLLTAKDLHQAEFREKFRGYDPEEVDAFLEQVAKGVDVLHQRLREAMERAERAEHRSRDITESDDTLRRTLVLAQRTADAAINEAKERAAKLVTDAEDYAARTKGEAEARARRSDEEAALRSRRSVEEAEAHGSRLIQEAHNEARKGSDELRTKLREEIAGLETARTRLNEDVVRLEAHVGSQRERVKASVEALTLVIDNPNALREAAVPEVQPIALPSPVENPALPQATLPPPTTAPSAEGAPDVDAGPPTQEHVIDLTSAGTEAMSTGETDAVASEAPVTGETAATPPAPIDEEMVNSFFEQGSFTDERWKGTWRQD